MKKYSLVLVLLFVSNFLFPQTQLTFQLSNPHVIYGSPDVFQFDLNIKADNSGNFLRDLQIYLDYNTLAFGADICVNNKITVAPLGLMDDHYQIVNLTDNTGSKIAIITDAFEELSQVGSSANFNEVPIEFMGFLRFQIAIEDANALGGIAFDESLMNGGQYMQSTTSTDPLPYNTLSAYENNIASLSLMGQDIQISAGWSGISSFISPNTADLELLLNPLADELVLLQNFTGVYLPVMDINTLGNWDVNSGYVVKMDNAAQFKMLGGNFEGNSVQVNEGWNLIPVFSSCELSTAQLFGDLLSSVLIIQEVAGVGVFWPEMEINTLPVLLPGKAYFVKMSSAETITFPACN